jgi:hypothetical protein
MDTIATNRGKATFKFLKLVGRRVALFGLASVLTGCELLPVPSISVSNSAPPLPDPDKTQEVIVASGPVPVAPPAPPAVPAVQSPPPNQPKPQPARRLEQPAPNPAMVKGAEQMVSRPALTRPPTFGGTIIAHARSTNSSSVNEQKAAVAAAPAVQDLIVKGPPHQAPPKTSGAKIVLLVLLVLGGAGIAGFVLMRKRRVAVPLPEQKEKLVTPSGFKTKPPISETPEPAATT